MRLNEQRNEMARAIENAACELIGLRSAIHRKMAAPYGDGSRSNMVNAETDVLPRLQAALNTLQNVMDEVSGKPHEFGLGTVEMIRVW